MVGIIAGGAYLPMLRMQRKSIADANSWFDPSLKGLSEGERTMCNWDEDVVTMGVEAVRDVFAAGRPPLATLSLASTSHPFAERQNAGVISEALSLGVHVRAMDLAGSRLAGTTALMNALDMAGRGAAHLVVGSENLMAPAGSQQEILYGDGAAALLVGAENVALELVDMLSSRTDFTATYRSNDGHKEYSWEERWVRDEGFMKIVPEALSSLLARQNISPSDIAQFILPAKSKKITAGVAAKIGAPAQSVVGGFHDTVGDTGAAHPLLALVNTLETAKEGDLILVTCFAEGCDALLFRATSAIKKAVAGRGISGALKRGMPETNYNKFQAFSGSIIRDLGKRSELDKQTALSALYRNRSLLTSFNAGKCNACGTVQMPVGEICVNPDCNAHEGFQPVSMIEHKGEIKSWTADRLTYDLNPPAYFGMVEFDNGARLMMDFTDVNGRSVSTGDQISVHFRIKQIDEQRGFKKYFWKAIPVGKEG